MTFHTRFASRGSTVDTRLMVRETVAVETFARSAISRMFMTALVGRLSSSPSASGSRRSTLDQSVAIPFRFLPGGLFSQLRELPQQPRNFVPVFSLTRRLDQTIKGGLIFRVQFQGLPAFADRLRIIFRLQVESRQSFASIVFKAPSRSLS